VNSVACFGRKPSIAAHSNLDLNSISKAAASQQVVMVALYCTQLAT